MQASRNLLTSTYLSEDKDLRVPMTARWSKELAVANSKELAIGAACFHEARHGQQLVMKLKDVFIFGSSRNEQQFQASILAMDERGKNEMLDVEGIPCGPFPCQLI